ncbi:hypothetical protein PMAYCL1PPCAC_06473 [Pristionchus mayeri]|uniref:Chitin-binding type-2 domain-containing protein n=1 Tax=Pristionchus mayeri TaxID=1317129 RepID=A0AAN4Z884_9BILA|nr:hypothetical protein PMAYCL1PPCAC_06473 [Pristionchus mayeri]
MFWYCSGGKLEHSLCPNGTLYNVEARKCDFRSNIRACGGTTKTRSSRLTTATTTTESPTTVPAEETTLVARVSTQVPYGRTYPTYAPRQRISGTVSKTPLVESSAGKACAGKEDGAHPTSSCSGEYVLCWAGTGKVMRCQEGLMFNEEQRGCDYPMKVAGCSDTQSAPSVYGTALASETSSAATLPIPRQPADFDCSTLSDGVYGSWCSRHFSQCVAGVAVTKSCTDGLVYNPGKKQCDYNENCVSPSSTRVLSDVSPTAIPAVTTALPSTDFDCSSRSDGLYSRGCEVEFYQCVAGKVYVKRCQDGLVFDDVTKGCDYPHDLLGPSDLFQLCSCLLPFHSCSGCPRLFRLFFSCGWGI